MCLASYENDLRYLRFLCEFGAPVDSCDYDGRRAAHICCAEGNLECALVLIEFHADFVSESVKDRWGLSPLDEADKHGHVELAKVIRALLEAKKTKMKREYSHNNVGI